jgi:hypothetical protein
MQIEIMSLESLAAFQGLYGGRGNVWPSHPLASKRYLTHTTSPVPKTSAIVFLAVSGQEPFIADTPEQAWTWVATTYPNDDGAIVQYIRRETGPRIYAGQR